MIVCLSVCRQVGGGGRGLLHGERPGAEEPGAAGLEHGRDLGAEEVMEADWGPKTTNRNLPRGRRGAAAAAAGRRRGLGPVPPL